MLQTEKNYLIKTTIEEVDVSSKENELKPQTVPHSPQTFFPQKFTNQSSNLKVNSFGKASISSVSSFESFENNDLNKKNDEKLVFEKPIQNTNEEGKHNLLSLSPLHLKSRPKRSLFDCEINVGLSPRKQQYYNNRIFYYIRGLCLARKFVDNMKKTIFYRKTNVLTTFHLKIINDWSCFKEKLRLGTQIVSKTSLSIKKIKRIWTEINEEVIKPIRIFHPTKKFHIVFDTIILIVTIFFFIVIPIDIGFSMDVIKNETGNSEGIIKNICFILLLLDIMINFNTAYLEKGELIKKRTLIIKHYLKEHFWKDVPSLLYFYLGCYYPYPYQSWLFNLSGALFVFRIRNIKEIFHRIENFLFIDDRFYNYLLFCKLIFRVLLISHFFACVWHMIGNNTSNSWLDYLQMTHDYWLKRYLYSLYYVVVVMITVGFGDITPKNTYEIGFTVFFIYFACGLFAYTINRIGLILQNINRSEHEFKQNMNILNGYMRQKKINFNLRTKIRNYLEYQWKDEKIYNNEVSREIINKLSKSLREELLLNANGVILKHFKMFHNNFSEASLKKLVLVMKEVKCIPGDIIYLQNETNDPYLYIIKKGKIDLFVEDQKCPNSKTIIQSLRKNQLFGEISFFSDAARETSAQSTTFTSLYAIKRKSFIDILKENNEDYEVFCQIKDEINIYNDYAHIYSFCESCKVFSHPAVFCPLLHFTLNNQRIAQKYYFSKPQERGEFKRKSKKHLTMNKFRSAEKNLSEHLFSKKVDSNSSRSKKSNDPKGNSFNLNLKMVSSVKSPKSNPPLTEYEFVKNIMKKPFENVTLNKIDEFNLQRPRSLPILPKLRKNQSLPTFNGTFESENSSLALPNNQIENNSENFLNSKKLLDISPNLIFPKNNIEENNEIPKNNNNNNHNNNNLSDISKTAFIFYESMKIYSSYFPKNNVELVIEEANKLILKNLKKKKIYNLNVVKKHWSALNPKGISGGFRPLSPSLKKSQLGNSEEQNFFKMIESQMKQKEKEKGVLGLFKKLITFTSKRKKMLEKREALDYKRTKEVVKKIYKK